MGENIRKVYKMFEITRKYIIERFLQYHDLPYDQAKEAVRKDILALDPDFDFTLGSMWGSACAYETKMRGIQKPETKKEKRRNVEPKNKNKSKPFRFPDFVSFIATEMGYIPSDATLDAIGKFFGFSKNIANATRTRTLATRGWTFVWDDEVFQYKAIPPKPSVTVTTVKEETFTKSEVLKMFKDFMEGKN